MGRRLSALGAAVAVHVALSAAHGVVHAVAPVPVAAWQMAYAGVVLLAAPVAGLAAARRGHLRAGAAIVAVSAAAGFAFEAPWHFLVPNPDHVAHATAAPTAFLATAVLTTAGDALAAVVAGMVRWQASG